MSKTFSIVMGALAVAGLALGGIAYASIPDGDGAIHGCYGNSNGQLRVVDEGQSCKNNETALDWNAQGQQGLQGEPGKDGQPGKDGEPGTPGAPGISHAYQASNPAEVDVFFHQIIATLQLPPGTYVVSAKAGVSFDPGAANTLASVNCILDNGGGATTSNPFDAAFADTFNDPFEHMVVSMVSTVQLSTTTAITLECGGHGSVDGSQLVAIAVDAVN